MNVIEYLLTQLGEESAEVIQECSKSLRFGLDDVHADKVAAGIPWPSNRERVAEELDDVFAMAEELRERGIIRGPDPARQHAKRVKVRKWMDYAIKAGALQSEQAVNK